MSEASIIDYISTTVFAVRFFHKTLITYRYTEARSHFIYFFSTTSS